MTSAWLYLLAAGVCEIVWAAGLKRYGFTWSWGGAMTVVVMLLSFVLLDRAMRTLPLGTSYAIWTGIGAVGAALYGMVYLGESHDWGRLVCIAAIVAGIVGLRLFSHGTPPVDPPHGFEPLTEANRVTEPSELLPPGPNAHR